MNNGRRDVRVCKKPFWGRMLFPVVVSCALKAYADNSGSPHADQRGRHTPANKTSDADIVFIKEHIQSFPKYQSHYSRGDNPARQYLNPDLSIAKTYLLYKDVLLKRNLQSAKGCTGRCLTSTLIFHSEGTMHTYCNRSCTHSLDLPNFTVSLYFSLHSSFSHPPPPSPHPSYFLSLLVLCPLSHLTLCGLSHTAQNLIHARSAICTKFRLDEATLAQLKGEWELHLCRSERAHLQLKDTALSKSDSIVMLVLAAVYPPPFWRPMLFFINANSGCII